MEREGRERDEHEHKGRGRETSSSLEVLSTEKEGESQLWCRERGECFSARRLVEREVERGSCDFIVRDWSGLLNGPQAF
jgi:hypothetical protein